MSMGDKIKHQAEEAKGHLKEKAGRATDDPDLEAEGRGEALGAEAKQAGDKVKDAAQDAVDAVDRMRDR